MVGLRVVTQRFGQPPLVFKEIIALFAQGGYAVLRKKRGVNLAARCLPGYRFRAVFTEAECTFIVIAPGAAGAVEPAGFVHPKQVTQVFECIFAVDNEAGGGFKRPEAAGSGAIGFYCSFEFHVFFRTAGCSAEVYAV